LKERSCGFFHRGRSGGKRRGRRSGRRRPLLSGRRADQIELGGYCSTEQGALLGVPEGADAINVALDRVRDAARSAAVLIEHLQPPLRFLA
jgi:hypothetical protein